ncbi:unnamed protein product [Heligmosomoides polygyrus]|uniref:Uncharacterized protein n=1 Tax=Heligmosomoides polygyrus TaxID=6339 RepID=A0A183GD47_HELPZ|nr:unnamed protein product [Heligmosomoides polygyrus]
MWETRWSCSKSRDIGRGFKAVLSGSRRTTSSAGNVSERFRDAIASVERFDDRLVKIVAVVEQRRGHFFSAYVPQSGCSEQTKDEFWSLLDEKTAEVPSEDMIVVAGDLVVTSEQRKTAQLSWWLWLWVAQRRCDGDYFEEISNVEFAHPAIPFASPVYCSVQKIAVSETEAALRKMKSGKATGPDDLPTVLWKSMGWCPADWLTEFFNQVVAEEKVPESWQQSTTIPIWKKKGSPAVCTS